MIYVTGTQGREAGEVRGGEKCGYRVQLPKLRPRI